LAAFRPPLLSFRRWPSPVIRRAAGYRRSPAALLAGVDDCQSRIALDDCQSLAPAGGCQSLATIDDCQSFVGASGPPVTRRRWPSNR
jgi:hypothetical protein